MLTGVALGASESQIWPGTMVRGLPVIRVGIEMTIADHLHSFPGPDCYQPDYQLVEVGA